jgi:5-methyltetrahydropteroyltriglutamate--homocysteine methyltransferase
MSATPSSTAPASSATEEDLLSRPLLTHEVGSLAKPNWRVKANAGRPIQEGDVEDARRWGERLNVAGHGELLDLLARAQSEPLTGDQKDEIKRWSSRYGVALLEAAGLDLVYDGEQQRFEMYAGAVAHVNGFEWRGSVRSFDNKYYSKAAVTGPISLRAAYHDEEFAFLRSVATAVLKVPITGAYTIADWSFDERFFTDTALGGAARERHARRKDARREMILDVATNMIRPNLDSLIGLGARWLQVDEPAGSTGPDELDLFVESFNESVRGLEGAVFSTHLCFSDYNLFFPAIEGMTECRQFAVGFANDDGRELGVSDEARPGYGVIRRFRDLSYRPALGLGVLDIHTDFIEPPELVRDRVLYAVEVFGDPARIHVMPDCGLRTRSWDVALAKLTNMVAGTEMAKDALGLATTGR